jgi:hypothetical protein
MMYPRHHFGDERSSVVLKFSDVLLSERKSGLSQMGDRGITIGLKGRRNA